MCVKNKRKKNRICNSLRRRRSKKTRVPLDFYINFYAPPFINNLYYFIIFSYFFVVSSGLLRFFVYKSCMFEGKKSIFSYFSCCL